MEVYRVGIVARVPEIKISWCNRSTTVHGGMAASALVRSIFFLSPSFFIVWSPGLFTVYDEDRYGT